MALRSAPGRSEAAEYYFTYIDQVGAGDIVEILQQQSTDLSHYLQSVSEERSLVRALAYMTSTT